jgi:hypothetical protein
MDNLSCAIDHSHIIGREISRRFRSFQLLAAGKEKHFWMRKLSVALQKDNAMTACAYPRDSYSWRNGRNYLHEVRWSSWRHGAKRGTRKRRFYDAFLSKPFVPRFDHWIGIGAYISRLSSWQAIDINGIFRTPGWVYSYVIRL